MPFYNKKNSIEETISDVNQEKGVGNCFLMAPMAVFALFGTKPTQEQEKKIKAVTQFGGTCKKAFNSMGYGIWDLKNDKNHWLRNIKDAVDKDHPACLLINWWGDHHVTSGSNHLIVLEGKQYDFVINQPAFWKEGKYEVDQDLKPKFGGASALEGCKLTITGRRTQQENVKLKVTVIGDQILTKKVKILVNRGSISKPCSNWDFGIWRKYGNHVVYVVGYDDKYVYARDQQNNHALIKVDCATWNCDDFVVGNNTHRRCCVDNVNIAIPPQ